MPNRILKESINESKSLSEVSFFAEDLYKRLITYADDYGRFNADYQIMRARLYPREIQIVSESDIEAALIELSGAGKIAFYTSEARNEIYGCFPNWHKHQRIRESKNKCPEPSDTFVNDWYLRRFIPINLKKKVIEKGGFKCQICGKYITSIDDASVLIKMGTGLFHIDHIVPVDQGGRATEENLRLTCPKCNQSRKKYFTPEEIIEMTQKEIVAESCGKIPQIEKKLCLNPIQSESNKNQNQNAREDIPILLEEFLKNYPCKGNRHLTEIAFITCLMEHKADGDALVQSAKNYAERCKILKTDEQYMKLPENFLRDMEYCQYLPGTYTKPKAKKTNNAMMQTDYGDLSELEKQLLSN